MEQTVYSVKDISEKTGFSHDTIRYYEKVGILPSPGRKENGQREYTKQALARFIFVSQLKRTHMPLKTIEQYIMLYASQDFEACYQVLYEHKLRIQSQIEDLAHALDKMNYKLDN
jgi:DNA-binding transcriptional MerR regulator